MNQKTNKFLRIRDKIKSKFQNVQGFILYTSKNMLFSQNCKKLGNLNCDNGHYKKNWQNNQEQLKLQLNLFRIREKNNNKRPKLEYVRMFLDKNKFSRIQ